MSHAPPPPLDHEFASLRLSALTQASRLAPLTPIANQQARPPSPPSSHAAPQPTSPPAPAALERLLHAWNAHLRAEGARMRDDLLRKMAADRTIMLDNLHRYQEVENQKKIQLRLAREREIERELSKIEEERIQLENEAHSEKMKKIAKDQMMASKEWLKKIGTEHAHISEIQQEIIAICSRDKLSLQVFNEYSSDLSIIMSSLYNVVENCKIKDATEKELQQALIVRRDIQNLKCIIIDSIEKMDNAAKTAEVIKQQAVQPVAAPVTSDATNVERPTVVVPVPKPEPATTAPKINDFYSELSYKKYVELKEFLANYENSYKQLMDDPSMKKFRFDCQKAVNTPVNAISSLSGEHIRDKFEKLSKLLSGETVVVGDVYVSAAQHPQGIYFCTNLLAKKIVQQGDQLVSSNSEASFPVASVCVALWARFPDFGKLLCAQFQKCCPYVVPMILPQLADQPIEEFYKSRGYLYSEEGEIEKQDKFLKRISGIFKLYAAIWVTSMPASCRMEHPHNLSEAWRWLAAFINLKPEADISATLLFDFLTTCGSDMYKRYNAQFYKILKYLTSEYFNELEKIDNGGPKSRLEVLIQNIISTGNIPPPSGILSNNLW